MFNIKRIYLSFLLILLFAVGSLLLLSCGEELEEEVKTVTSISISPSSASLEVGATQSFAANAFYSDGTSGAVIPTWSVSGAIGTIISVGYTGLFTATAEGTGTVVATYEGKIALASVIVAGGLVEGLATIEVNPATAITRVGEKQTFAALGITATGESIDILPTWSITGDPIGILTFSGTTATLEANAQGSATISCTSDEVTGYSYVTVEGFVIEITVETDTYVDEENPLVAYGSDTSLKAGYVSAVNKYYETYLKFPMGAIPSGATIESATLKVYPSSAGSSSLQLKRLDSAFTNITAWGSKPTIGTFLLSSPFSAGSYNSLSSSELRDLVSSWESGAITNHGLAIVQDGTVDGTVVILSLENGSNFPLLRIEYSK